MTWQREIPKVTVFHGSSRWEFLKLPGWTKATILLPILYQSLTFHFLRSSANYSACNRRRLVAARSCSPLAGPWWIFQGPSQRGSQPPQIGVVLIVSCGFPITTHFPDIVWHKAPHVSHVGLTRTIKRDLELLKPCQDKHSDDEGASDLWIILFFVWGKPENLMVQSLIFPTNIWQIKFGRIFQSETNPCWISWGVKNVEPHGRDRRLNNSQLFLR